MGRSSDEYGRTPWGRWFLEVLDSYAMGERLNRGRRYANAGKVLSLSIKDRRVSAKVKGNYRPSYTVIVDFPALQEKERVRVLELIEEDPALLARIAAGELPETFLEKLKRSGINLIPTRWRDMVRACACPDYGDPCKHMAALYYVLAKEVDADPHLLFRLRGVDLSELTRRYGGTLERELTAPFEINPADRVLAAGRGLSALPAGEGRPAPVIPEIPHCGELICSLLPPSPPFCERDFAVLMAEFYHHAARFIPWSAGTKNEEDEHSWSRSHWTIECFRPRPGAQVFLIREDLRGEKTRLTPFEAFLRFRGFSSDDGTESYTFLFYLFKFLNLVCGAGALIPCVYSSGGRLEIVWQPFERLPQIGDTLSAIAALGERMLSLPRRGKTKNPVYADGPSAARLLSSALLGEWVRWSDFKPKGAGAAAKELLELFFRGKELEVDSPALRSLPLAIDRWLSVLHTDFRSCRYRFTVKPAAEKRSAKTSADSEGGYSAFVLSIEGALPSPGKSPDGDPAASPITYVHLKDLARTSAGIAALKAPTALSNYLPEIRALFSRNDIRLSEERLVGFLDSGAELLSRLGIEVILPRSLHRELKPRLVARVEGAPKAQGTLVSYLNLESLLDWNWQIAIGDEIISGEEFDALLKGKSRLIKFRDMFIHVDPAELLRLLKKSKEAQPSVNEFLKSHFSGNSVLSFDAEKIIEELFKERTFAIPPGLAASLRPYQERGYNWICSLLRAGFGCILADDMGLGKTVQAIAVLLRFKADRLLADKALVVAPATLLENWEREFSRFAPALKVSRYHGSGRVIDKKSDVFLTTYQTASRDREKLIACQFSILIADEAHLMKNATTAGARTLKELRSRCRLALSGTPVENRLEDMRSLFDFVLPGYLGTAAEFKAAYRIPIEVLRNAEKAEALKKITAPFLLRRLKTDKTVIADLPEKVTINEYAGLEKDQLALYESVVSHTLKRSEKLENPRDRSALVLQLLTSLKQICDHPRVFDKESPAVSGLSGKAMLLLTLLRDIIDNREKALIFSQYVETLRCLETIITGELGEAPLVYHGGMGQKQRTAIVDTFQNDPSRRILLISLKAGGLGLNLTGASRVIHYDLWYNPAVENQATDRAFRIGQKQNVFVHRFITRNSFEEKIDRMLSAKRELADMTVSSGESWLSRMSHAELRELFARD
ncbi:MAG: DEAD/DEAH box helicase [Treponema sp.]|nr:DEAD/DEAH box helicase [Treponema sp.]